MKTKALSSDNIILTLTKDTYGMWHSNYIHIYIVEV